MKNDADWIGHTAKQAPIFSPEQYREILMKMPIDNPRGLRARVGLVMMVDCNMRDSDVYNVKSCNVVNVSEA